MYRRHPESTRPYTLFPYTALFRSIARAPLDEALARNPRDFNRRLADRRDPRPAILRDREAAEPDQRQFGRDRQAAIDRGREHTRRPFVVGGEDRRRRGGKVEQLAAPPQQIGRARCRESGGQSV